MQARNLIPDFSNNETFLYENNCNYDSYKLSYKFAYICFLSFRSFQKQESNSQHLGGLVTRLNIWFSVYSKSRSTSMVCRIQQTFTKDFFTRYSCFCYMFLMISVIGASGFRYLKCLIKTSSMAVFLWWRDMQLLNISCRTISNSSFEVRLNKSNQ